jgi:hypothetical protein
MNLELNDMKAEALAGELSLLIENDRYPLSPRIGALKEILGKLRPGARSPRTAIPATASRAAEQGPIPATRLASDIPVMPAPVHSSDP